MRPRKCAVAGQPHVMQLDGEPRVKDGQQTIDMKCKACKYSSSSTKAVTT